jgi:hypothetical protein
MTDTRMAGKWYLIPRINVHLSLQIYERNKVIEELKLWSIRATAGCGKSVNEIK